MGEVIYRKAIVNDAYNIEFVAANSWMQTYSNLMPYDYLKNRIDNIDKKVDNIKDFLSKTTTYYVAEVDNKIVGILHYSKCNDDKYKKYGQIGAIYVLKEYQGLGIGKNLFKIAVEGIIEFGYNSMVLECIKDNPSIGFYKKYDGNIVSEYKRKIDDFYVDAYIIEFNNLKEVLNKLNYKNKNLK